MTLLDGIERYTNQYDFLLCSWVVISNPRSSPLISFLKVDKLPNPDPTVTNFSKKLSFDGIHSQESTQRALVESSEIGFILDSIDGEFFRMKT